MSTQSRSTVRRKPLRAGRLVPAAIAVLLALATQSAAQDVPDGAESEQAAPSPAPPLSATEWKRLKKVLPAHLWLTDPRKRRKARIDAAWTALHEGRVTLTKEQFGEVGTILRAGSPFTTQKSRSATIDVPTGHTLENDEPETMPVRVAVSSKYKPGCGRAFPLIITLHGGPCSELGRAQEGSGNQFRAWKGFASTTECIVAAPALTGQRYGEREWTFLSNLIDELDRRYNVDRDAILLTGHSWGGIMTWQLGPAHADSFALLAPFICATNPGAEHLSSCRVLPIHHVQGNRDGKWMIDSGRARRDLLDELGYDHTYAEPNGGHEMFGTEIAKIAKEFVRRRRNLYAQEIVRGASRGGDRGSDTWYWVRTQERSFRAYFEPEARVVDVEVSGPFEVLLSDEMLDLDGKFSIARNGEAVWYGTVERRLDFTLEHIRETGDRGRVFAASVKID